MDHFGSNWPKMAKFVIYFPQICHNNEQNQLEFNLCSKWYNNKIILKLIKDFNVKNKKKLSQAKTT